MADTSSVELESDPIRREWIRAGGPQAFSKILARSRDWIANVVVWECTSGRFDWRYSNDEILFVVSGEASITDEQGNERHFGPGDVVYFPAGSSCTWIVPHRIRKVAVVRETLLPPVGLGVKIWKKLVRTVRRRRGTL